MPIVPAKGIDGHDLGPVRPGVKVGRGGVAEVDLGRPVRQQVVMPDVEKVVNPVLLDEREVLGTLV
jgi:hypothetical protein